MSNQTNIPPPTLPFSDPVTGLVNRTWYFYLINQFQKLGGTSSVIPVDQSQAQAYAPSRPQPSFSDILQRINLLEDLINSARMDDDSSLWLALENISAQLNRAIETPANIDVMPAAPSEGPSANNVGFWL